MATNSNGEKINITTDEVMDVIAILDSSLNLLEETMLSSISNDFVVLSSLDLFSEGLNKLKTQINTLRKSNENLMTKITLHVNELEELEKNIINEIDNVFVSGNAGSAGSGSYYSSIEEIGVSEVKNNISISNDFVAEEIGNSNNLKLDEIIKFLNINRGEYSMNDLLLSDVGSGILLCLLKKFYGESTIQLNSEESEDSLNIQKLLLEKVLNSDTDICNAVFKDTELMVAKEYFISIAKENNISLSELLLDEKYEILLLDSIKKLYLGEKLDAYDVDETTIKVIRNLVDKVAEDNGVKVDKVLSDVDYLGDLKGV